MPDWEDDTGISDEEFLLRRIHPDDIKFDAEGDPYPSGGAFRTQQLSVNIASRTTYDAVLANYPRHSLAAFKVSVVRSEECIIVSDLEDPTHAMVCRKDDPHKRLSKPQAYKLASQATLVVYRPPAN